MDNMSTAELKDMARLFEIEAKDQPLGSPEWLNAATTVFLIGKELARRGA